MPSNKKKQRESHLPTPPLDALLHDLVLEELSLRDHAQRALIGALLREYGPATQSQIIRAYEEYLTALRFDPLQWRQKAEIEKAVKGEGTGDVGNFITEPLQFFLLPTLRGGNREGTNDRRLILAVIAYELLLDHLKLRVKRKNHYHNNGDRKLKKRKEDIEATLRDALGSQDMEQLMPFLDEWKHEPGETIACEAAARLYAPLESGYLKRRIPVIRKRPLYQVMRPLKPRSLADLDHLQRNVRLVELKPKSDR